MTKTTGEVAAFLDLSEVQVQAILRRRSHLRPPKDGSGRRAWRPEDIESLRAFLAERSGGATP